MTGAPLQAHSPALVAAETCAQSCTTFHPRAGNR